MTQGEDVSECRDANEDHGLGFDDIGCDSSLEDSQTDQPVPDDDATCWEIHSFGYSEGDDGSNDGGNDDEDTNDEEPDQSSACGVAVKVVCAVCLFVLGLMI